MLHFLEMASHFHGLIAFFADISGSLLPQEHVFSILANKASFSGPANMSFSICHLRCYPPANSAAQLALRGMWPNSVFAFMPLHFHRGLRGICQKVHMPETS